MDEQTKKKLFIGLGIAALALTGIFAKNKWEQMQFKPLDKDLVIKIMKKAKKDNYIILKKITSMAMNMAQQFRQINPQMIKTYLESPESPVRIPDQFEANYQKICKQNNVKYNDLNRSIQYYIKEGDNTISHLAEEGQRDFQNALTGKLPPPKATVPQFLTKDKILQIQKKLTMKKYLVQIQMYRKLKGVPKQKLAQDTQLMKSLPNPQDQEDKVLQQEGLGANDQPASVVFTSAVMKYQKDQDFLKKIEQIENNYKKIFNRYLPKMQQQTMTQDQINQLEDEIIYFESGHF